MYYIIEHQTRPDGIVNVSETSRSTFANALSYYYERLSKLVVSEIFTSAAVMLVDENLNVKLHDIAETQYKPTE